MICIVILIKCLNQDKNHVFVYTEKHFILIDENNFLVNCFAISENGIKQTIEKKLIAYHSLKKFSELAMGGILLITRGLLIAHYIYLSVYVFC